MPTAFSDIVPVRRVAVGDCSGPLGSGFDALARTAYAALLRANWSQSADPPFLPVHDNGQTANKTIPRGDAWKCSYGYDATARTERSACGAVCYTFALPADATAGTPANISTVALSLTGDRYLDAGVDLYLVPSDSPTPPSIPDLLALEPVGTYCATSDQSPTKPNERHGVTEAVEAAPGFAAQPYLHVALLLHDYTTNRGAWIEGGAMLEGATATITFSREVAADSPAPVRILRLTDRLDDSGGTTHDAAGYASVIMGEYHYFAPDAGALSDVEQIVRLSVSGAFPAKSPIVGFGPMSDSFECFVRYNSANNGNPAEYFATLPMFYAPPGGIAVGLSVSASFSSRGAETDLDVAIVQLPSAPPREYGSSAIGVAFFAPLVQMLDGGGPDIIAMGSGHIGATPSTATVALPILRSPTKPYLAIVAIPRSDESGVAYDNSPYLIAQ